MKLLYKRLAKRALILIFYTIFSISLFAQTRSPKNIILVIGDGMGHSCIQAAGYYITGKDNGLFFENFPVMTWQSTYNAKNPISGTSEERKAVYHNLQYRSDKAWLDFNWVRRSKSSTYCDAFTDSAAAATALSTGKKTYGGGINIDVDGSSLTTIAEHAINIGKKAGVVTSVQMNNATPAGFIAHNKSRSNYVEIASEMLLKSKLSVIMGAGHPDYDNDAKYKKGTNGYEYVGGQQMWNDLVAGKTSLNNSYPADIDGDGSPDAWTLIQDLDDFVKIGNGEKVAPKRLLGIPRVGQTLQAYRTGRWSIVHNTPYNSNIPTLSQMSKAALNALDNENGFFVMIEAGAVDWANTSNSPGRMIEEMMDMNNTVGEIIKWIEANGGWDDNLLIVTTDHECGYILGPNTKKETVNNPVDNPVINKGKGNMPDFTYNVKHHTNMLCPVYAKGAGAELLKTHESRTDYYRGGYIDNTDIARTMFSLWDDKEPQIKNFIMMVADGSGFNQVLATNYYEGKAQSYESFPVVTPMSTFAGRSGNHTSANTLSLYTESYSSWRAWTEFDYYNQNNTTSGSAATAMATGVKTYKDALNIDLKNMPLKTLPEIAADKGKSTGIVTTVAISQATSAGLGGAHNRSKDAFNEIAQELFFNTKLSVIMGAGNPGYDNGSNFLNWLNFSWIEQNTWEALCDGRTESNGQTLTDIDGDSSPDAWTLIQDSIDFANIAAGKNVPLRLAGIPKVNETLQAYRINSEIGKYGGLRGSTKIKPDTYSKTKGIPNLPQMSLAALNVLNQNSNGFYLAIEGGAIDWANQANQLGIMIEEHRDFNAAVDSVIAWVEKNSNWDETLLVVTSSHESGYLVGPNHKSKSDNRPTSNPIVNNGKRVLPGYSYHSAYSTNQLVPLYAKGAGAGKLGSHMNMYDYLRGYYMDNADIPRMVLESWNKLPDLSPGIVVHIDESKSDEDNGKNRLLNIRPTIVDTYLEVEADKGKTIEIFDLNGRCILRTKANNTISIINLNSLSKGLYIVKVGERTAKMVKK